MYNKIGEISKKTPRDLIRKDAILLGYTCLIHIFK